MELLACFFVQVRLYCMVVHFFSCSLFSLKYLLEIMFCDHFQNCRYKLYKTVTNVIWSLYFNVCGPGPELTAKFTKLKIISIIVPGRYLPDSTSQWNISKVYNNCVCDIVPSLLAKLLGLHAWQWYTCTYTRRRHGRISFVMKRLHISVNYGKAANFVAIVTILTNLSVD